MQKISCKALGESNRGTTESYEQVLEALKSLGREEKAVEVSGELLKARNKALGKGNGWTTEGYHQVIQALKKLEKKTEALENEKAMFEYRKKI